MKTKVRIIENGTEPQVLGMPKKNIVHYLAKEARNFYLLHGPEDTEELSLHIGPRTKMKVAEITDVVKGPVSMTVEYILSDTKGILNLPEQIDKQNKPTVSYDGEKKKLEKLI